MLKSPEICFCHLSGNPDFTTFHTDLQKKTSIETFFFHTVFAFYMMATRLKTQNSPGV